MANERAEYCEEEADPGPLVLPSRGPKLPDLECSLASLEPVAADMFNGCLNEEDGSLMVALPPIGVARESFGAVGLLDGRN